MKMTEYYCTICKRNHRKSMIFELHKEYEGEPTPEEEMSLNEIKITNASQKFNIPFSKILLTRKDMEGVLPIYRKNLILACVKETISSRLYIEKFLEKKAAECGIILPNWNIFHNKK